MRFSQSIAQCINIYVKDNIIKLLISRSKLMKHVISCLPKRKLTWFDVIFLGES